MSIIKCDLCQDQIDSDIIDCNEYNGKEDNDNEWQYFRNVLNLRNTEGQFLVNDIQSITSVNYSFNNYNTLSPAVYLLSIFTHMLKTIDFVFAGSFAVNKFAKQRATQTRYKMKTYVLMLHQAIIARQCHVK